MHMIFEKLKENIFEKLQIELQFKKNTFLKNEKKIFLKKLKTNCENALIIILNFCIFFASWHWKLKVILIKKKYVCN